MKKRKNANGKKEQDSRVKTRKGSLEQKREKFWKLMGEANRRMKGNDRTASESSMRSFTLSKTKNLNSSFQNAFPRILESITMGLDACQIAIFRKKWIFLKMLDFQIIHFSRKRPWKCATPFCSTKLWIFWVRSSDSKSMPHSKISNSDHQFFGSLESKKNDFSGLINKVLKMFFRHWGSLILKIKRIFE